MNDHPNKNEPSYVPEPEQPLTTEQKIDQILILAINTAEDVTTITTKLTAVEETLAQHTETLSTHTQSLAALLTKKKTREDEKTVSVARFDRLEKWAGQVGVQLGIKLEL